MRALRPAVCTAISLALLAGIFPAWGSDRRVRAPAQDAALPCPPLTVEDHGDTFSIEKRPCHRGGMTVPKQEVVPIVAPQRQPAPSSERRTRRGSSESAEREPRHESR